MRTALMAVGLFIMSGASGANISIPHTPADSGYLTSFDGTKIYYEVHGSGKAVLLVHGFIVNSNSWKGTALFHDLLQDGYKVILLDLRGNGRSDKPHDTTAYAHDAEAKDIMALMDFLHIPGYSAVGYSRGSIITARLLVLDRRVRNAVLGGMGADFTNPMWPRRIMFYHALRGDNVPELKGMVEYVHKQGLDQQALACMQKEQPATTKAWLHQVKQPVLVISGDRDSADGSPAELASIIPGSSLVIIPGNHNQTAATTQFSEGVVAFLRKNRY